MEVPGQLAAPSKQDSNLYCIPCERDGLKETAYGYCQDCMEHLCESCYKYHRKPRPTQNHILLDKNAMAQHLKLENMRSDEKPYFCTKHNDKVLEYFCNNHGSLACYVCLSLEHNNCKAVYIPDVSGNLSDEFTNLVGRIDNLVEKCKTNVKLAEEADAHLDKIYKHVVEDVKLFRREINDSLDRMESEMINEAKIIVQMEKSKQEEIKAESIRILNEISSSFSLLHSLNDEKQDSKLFIAMKTVAPRLERFFDKERQTVEDNEVCGDISFIRNHKTFDILKYENIFGKISTYRKASESRTVNARYERTINMNTFSGLTRCDVVGIIQVSTSQIIVADCFNKKLLLVDVHDSRSLITELALTSDPQDATQLPLNKLAVALPEERCIQIISFSDTSLSPDRRIELDEKCYCVAYGQNKLVVGCNPVKLIILDLDGMVIQVFETPELLAWPEKIIVSNDEKFLFVSEYYYNCSGRIRRFKKLDWEGNVIAKLEKQGSKGRTGTEVLVDDTLLLCFYDNIVRLSNNLNRFTQS